eukprot:1553421-Pleurochrysis_carterae.AAC.2
MSWGHRERERDLEVETAQVRARSRVGPQGCAKAREGEGARGREGAWALGLLRAVEREDERVVLEFERDSKGARWSDSAHAQIRLGVFPQLCRKVCKEMARNQTGFSRAWPATKGGFHIRAENQYFSQQSAVIDGVMAFLTLYSLLSAAFRYGRSSD